MRPFRKTRLHPISRLGLGLGLGLGAISKVDNDAEKTERGREDRIGLGWEGRVFHFPAGS